MTDTEMPQLTDEQRKAQVAALLEERSLYAARGLEERVAQVDAQLRLLGASGGAPQKRSERRS